MLSNSDCIPHRQAPLRTEHVLCKLQVHVTSEVSKAGENHLFTQASLVVPLLHFVLQPLFVAFILAAACFHLPNAIGDLSLLLFAPWHPQKLDTSVGFIICLPAPSAAPAKVIRTKGWELSKYHSTIALDTSKSLSTHEKILKGILGLLSSQRSEEINEIYKKYVIAILLSISPTRYVRLPGTNSQIALSEKKTLIFPTTFGCIKKYCQDCVALFAAFSVVVMLAHWLHHATVGPMTVRALSNVHSMAASAET